MRRRHIIGVSLLLAGAIAILRPAFLAYRVYSTEIWDAVQREELDVISHYATAGGDLDCGAWLKGTTPLMVSLRERKKRSFRHLLELGANPNVECRDSLLPVQLAALYFDSSWLQLLLECGGDPNSIPRQARGSQKSPPLFCSRTHENSMLLIQHGANIHSVDEVGNTLLVSLVLKSHQYRTILYLLENGADYKAECRNGMTLLRQMENLGIRFIGRHAIDERAAYTKVRAWLVDKEPDADRYLVLPEACYFDPGEERNERSGI